MPEGDEDLSNVFVVNVTLALRFNLDPKLEEKGGLMINSGKSSKQNCLGFYNPIPSFLPEY